MILRAFRVSWLFCILCTLKITKKKKILLKQVCLYILSRTKVSEIIEKLHASSTEIHNFITNPILLFSKVIRRSILKLNLRDRRSTIARNSMECSCDDDATDLGITEDDSK